MVLVVVLDDLEAAFIHIKVNVALLKIRCMRLPYLRFGMAFLDGFPGFFPDALAMCFSRYKKKIQRVVLGLFINAQHRPTNLGSIQQDVTYDSARRVE